MLNRSPSAEFDADVIIIGYGPVGATLANLLGLRGVLADHFGEREPNAVIREQARGFRFELNQMYMTRWIDLLTRYRDQHGDVPPGNRAGGPELPTLGHFSRA